MTIPELEHFGSIILDLRKARQKEKYLDILRKELENTQTIQSKFFLYTFNPYTTFGLRKIPTEINNSWEKPLIGSYELSLTGFLTLLNDLIHKNITGYKAQKEVYIFRSKIMGATRLGFDSILSRTLRCGVNVKTVNMAIPSLIPTFQVAKANSWKYKKEVALSMCNSPMGAIVDKKENGERRIYIRDKNLFLTSSGAEDYHFPELNHKLKSIFRDGTVLDGELVKNDGGLYDVRKLVGTKRTFTLEEANVCYIIFDVLTLKDWIEQKNNVTQHERTDWVQTFVPKTRYIKPIDSWRIGCEEDMDYLYFGLLKDGWEGIIIKHPLKPYLFKRHNFWIKRKRENSVDIPIIKLLPGNPNTKFAFTLGRFVCILPNGKEVKVSPGRITESMRDEIWTNPNQFIGRTIEVVHQEETPDGSLQHPRFHRFREDK